MIPALRRQFNQSFTPQKYQALLTAMDARVGCHVKYRQAETPCFFPLALLNTLAASGQELMEQLLANPEYPAASTATIPEEFRVPNEPPRPLFVQADFGLTEDLQPKLVEIQGFPSLYGYQPVLARQYLETYSLDPSLRYFYGDLDDARYRELLGRAILDGHDPENVILMEIDPERQKTLPDFKATEQLLGIRSVCITKLRKQGRKLFYERDGRLVPVHRIYNRVIVDELVRLGVKAPFDWREDLDVEWAGHPNWFFRLSKFSIPYFKHRSVPRTSFLSDVAYLPHDLDNYVLKPLFSFAGLGVIIGPTREQVESIAADQRHQYILQERVNFAPLIDTPQGPAKAEIRVMYIWLDQLIPTSTIIRMGRGKMMGVDHNRNMEWVGASAALYPRKD
ncbi:MAG TPA: hypothetical protein VM120_06305 [Bryobacteraceae bacterium]|nr:hypothetical protein [Bryobacteraceae bacterium]